MDNAAWKKIKDDGGEAHTKVQHIPDCDDDECDRADHASLRGWRYDRRHGWVEK